MSGSTEKTDAQRQRRERYVETFEPYARSTLLPRMGIPSGDLSIELPAFGERSLVLFLTAGGREMVARSYPRRSGRVRTIRAMRFSLRRGVRVPRILHIDRSWAARRALGHTLIIEERIRGNHPLEYPDRDRMIAITATGISAMHNLTRARWGNLRVGRRTGYFRRQMEVAEKHVRRSEKLGSDLARRWPEVRRRLGEFEPMARRIRRFSFCHRAVAADNLKITPEDELCLLDVQRLSFDHFAANLVRSLLLFEQDEETQTSFLKLYFEAAAGRSREEFERWRPFFRTLQLLRLSNYARQKKSRLPDGSSLAETYESEILDLLV
jgi:aminoglycoside phosphotransferase (APT) family kinase protein